jgi:hypothetical protein
MQLSEVFAVLIQGTGFVPSRSDTWVVLPLVEKAEMLVIGVVESYHCEVLLQMWNPSAIDDRARFGFRFPDWMLRMPWERRELC